jgi:hypothetical protein
MRSNGGPSASRAFDRPAPACRVRQAAPGALCTSFRGQLHRLDAPGDFQQQRRLARRQPAAHRRRRRASSSARLSAVAALPAVNHGFAQKYGLAHYAQTLDQASPPSSAAAAKAISASAIPVHPDRIATAAPGANGWLIRIDGGLTVRFVESQVPPGKRSD